jgi:hypothetical protein
MSKVFVLDTDKRPLDPIHSAQARQLLRNKKAAIFRRFPFTIILKKSQPDSIVQLLRLKLDPGAKFTGIALVNDTSGEVVFAAKQIHFGFQTGDIIKSVVTSGKKVGEYVGRVLCRATGSFDIATKTGRISGISYKYCSAIHKKDGYSYAF